MRHLAIVEALVMRAKARQMHEELESGGVGYGATCRQMLRTTDNEGNTALHGAVRNGYIDVVEILIKEDPDRCSYCANDCGETPLFIAAERGSFQIVAEILETCTSVAHDGPDGKTALHAAVMSFDLDTTSKILEKKKNLTKETDQYGWTPLHYAAYYGYFSIASLLLSFDVSSAYIAEKDKKMTALHMAASQGQLNVMEKIMFKCPDTDRGLQKLECSSLSHGIQELSKVVEGGPYRRGIIRVHGK